MRCEFACELVTHFNRWCIASDVKGYDDLCDLVVLDQFKNSVPEPVAMYISEQKVRTATEGRGDSQMTLVWPGKFFLLGEFIFLDSHGVREPEDVCHFCHKKGHWKKKCNAFKSRNKHGGTQVKPAALAAPVSNLVMTDQPSHQLPSVASKPDLRSYLLCISKGKVSLVGSEQKVLVTILRDTGAFDSFILLSDLP